LAVTGALVLAASVTVSANTLGKGVYVLGGQNNIFRHTLVLGMPSQQPDYAYGTISGFFALGPGGDVFAQAAAASPNVTRYVLDTNVPFSSLEISLPGYKLGLGAIAVDVHQFLYVSYANSGSTGNPYGVLVYPPNATGNAAPIQNIGLAPRRPPFVFYMAFDSKGELFLSNAAMNVIYVYSNPTTHPTLARTITSAAIHGPQGIAIDLQGELYVLNQGSNTIAAFRDDVGKNARADRTISINNPGWTLFGGVATDQQFLFASVAQGKVCQLNKVGNGPQNCLSVLSYPKGRDVKVGP
jgi:hypothetical protein